MKKQNCHIQLHDFFRRRVFIDNPWCGFCDESGVGIFGPDEFDVDGDTYILGYCRKCGIKIVSKIIEKNIVS